MSMGIGYLKTTFLLDIIRWMGALGPTVHLLIRRYVGIRGYCAIKQMKDSQTELGIR